MSWNGTLTTVVGNIVGTIGKRSLDDGTVVASFRVASNERRWSREENAWADGARLFLTVTCWRRLGENVLRSFVAGDPVVVFGRLRTTQFEREGRRGSVVEMEAITVGPDLTRCSVAVARAVQEAPDGHAGEPDGGRAPVQAAASSVPVAAAAGV